MTIEFPDEPDAATAPDPGRTVEIRRALPWSLPAALALVALFLPVTTIFVPGDVDAVGTFRAATRISLHAFGQYTEAGSSGAGSGGPVFGWVWLVLLVGFAGAGVWSAVRPDASWPGVLGAVVGGVGGGSVAAVELAAGSSDQTSLAAGAWDALAAAVVGLGVGLAGVHQSARAKAGG